MAEEEFKRLVACGEPAVVFGRFLVPTELVVPTEKIDYGICANHQKRDDKGAYYRQFWGRAAQEGELCGVLVLRKNESPTIPT